MSPSTSKAHLTAADFSDNSLQDWLQANAQTAYLVSPGGTIVEYDLRNSPVIMATGKLSDLAQLSGMKPGPHFPPILLFLEPEQAATDYEPLLRTFLVDILVFPVSYDLLAAHLTLLQKVGQMQTEHQSYAASMNRQLNLLADRDGLTGLYNRRTLLLHLEQQMKAAIDRLAELSICMLNIDYFKKVNQTVGLENGDRLLNEMAARLTEATGSKGRCYRLSGENFVVIIPEFLPEEALDLGWQISRSCSNKPFLDGSQPQSITLSGGVASLQQHKPRDINEFLNMAETALYIAKTEGRNRISNYPLNARTKEYQHQHSLLFIRRTIENLLGKSRNATISSLTLLAENIVGQELRNQLTLASSYLKLLGSSMGLSNEHINTFENAVTLHTCFKQLLYNDLISKTGKLNSEEMKMMSDLPLKLTELTETFDFFAQEREILETHTERFDGTGLPYGLKGDEIPLGARIFNIVDSIVAMSSARPYRQKLSGKEILCELKNGAGGQFDPGLVRQLFSIIKDNKLFSIDQNELLSLENELVQEFPELHP